MVDIYSKKPTPENYLNCPYFVSFYDDYLQDPEEPKDQGFCHYKCEGCNCSDDEHPCMDKEKE